MRLLSSPYKEYRVSDNEWCEHIPAVWNETRVKNIFKLITDIAPNDNDFELLSLYSSIGVRPRKDMEQRGNKSVTTDGYWIVRKGDIIVNKLLAWMGAIGLSEYDGVTSPAYDILRESNQNVDARFYTYLFRTEKSQAIFKKHSRGIMDVRLRLYFDKFGAMTVPFPPIAEQRSIAHYLDTKTAQIDRKIDLLTQKATQYGNLKQSLINEAVTRGLDRSVVMKDSGIEWLGEVPEHWQVEKLKRISNVKRGASPRPIDDPKYFDDIHGEYGWVRIEDVTKSSKYLLETKERLSKLGSSKSVKMKSGDIFLSIAGSVGKPIISKINCCIHDGFVYFVGLKQHIDFMYYLFNCANIYSGLGKIGTQLNLNIEIVGGISIPLPPLSEQKAIAHYLDTKTAQIDQIIQTINTQIEALKELRKTLINDVVTGKIKVV